MKKMDQFVQRIPGEKGLLEASPWYMAMMEKYIALWVLYVFVNPHLTEGQVARVADACSEALKFENEIKRDRRQPSLF
jgi:hypothetical protein